MLSYEKHFLYRKIMSDFDFNEHIQENSGQYGALAGMAHLRNQSKQGEELRKQRRLLEEQAKSAKNQAEAENGRLQIEKERFALEQKEKELQRKKLEQVKGLRKLMANISGDIDEMEVKYL